MLAKVFRVRPTDINDETSTKTLKRWDSFRHIQLVVALEEAYSVKLTTGEITSIQSFDAIRTLLRDKGVI